MRHQVPWALGLALAGQAAAQVTVTPQSVFVFPGEQRRFTARHEAGTKLGPPAPAWEWTLHDGEGRPVAGPEWGTLDAQGGYAAPQREEPQLVRVRATWPGGARPWSETTLLVLPQAFYPIRQTLAPFLQDTFSQRLPFLDLETGRRFAPAEVTAWSPAQHRQPETSGVLFAPAGRPVQVTWNPPPGAEGQLLSYRDGDQVIRKDVTGQREQELTFQGRVEAVRIEALYRQGSGWRSWDSARLVRQRGMLPAAGGDHPGHLDGTGLAARFREPFDLDTVYHDTQDGIMTDVLVSDAGSHCIRALGTPDRVTTVAGDPDQPGHRDGKALEARFHGPTFLAATSFIAARGHSTWSCAVADTGNHVVRLLGSDGTVSTLAGVTGRAGHQDGPGLQAEFLRPLGIARDHHGNLYVADQGNCVIRKITPKGMVTTVAGQPGEPGSQDGTGAAARFTTLKGLAAALHGHSRETLYVADGHAIRAISLPEAKVSTLLGVVASPGFQDARQDSLEDREAALQQPCLNDPWGLRRDDGQLSIADRGNHAFRCFSFASRTLRTLVGDPGQGGIRWGLLRDGMAPPPDARFATLAAPRSLLQTRYTREFLVTTGSRLARVDLDNTLDPLLAPPRLQGPGTMAAGPLVVTFSVGFPLAFAYTVEFVEADGTVAGTQSGDGVGFMELTAAGELVVPGSARVRLRCTSPMGLSSGAEATVQVR